MFTGYVKVTIHGDIAVLTRIGIEAHPELHTP